MSAGSDPHTVFGGRVRKGPLLMALTALVFTVMVGFVKVARVELDSAEIIAWRGIVGIPLAVLMLRGRWPVVTARRTLLARVLLGFSAMVCFFTAAKGLPLADHSLLTKLQPLLVAIVAPLFLGISERSEPRVWAALVAGLFGCGLLLAPDLQGGSVWGLWAVAAAAFSAGAHTCLRALGRTDHPAVVVFWFQVAIAPLSIALQLGTEGSLPRVPSPHLWLPIAGIGGCAVLGQLLMTRAYQLDRASVVAGASYTAPLWAVAGDLLFFATTPSWTTLIGGVLIVGAGLAVSMARDKPERPSHQWNDGGRPATETPDGAPISPG